MIARLGRMGMGARLPATGARASRDQALEVVKVGEIVLAAPDGLGGYSLIGRFAVADGTLIAPVFQGLQPPIIAIGEQGRDTQPFASSIIYDDLTAGIGVLHQDERRHANRFWFGPVNARRRDQVTLLRRKVDRGRPVGVEVEAVGAAGGVFDNRVWVAWGDRVRQWTDVNGWTDGTAVGDRSLSGALSPTTNPLAWEGGWFWPLGAGGFDYFNGAAWVHVATACVGFVAYAGALWFVDGVGQVWSTNDGASAIAAKIAAGTLGAGDFTARVRVSDRCQGMMLFTTADASADVVPYVVGYKQLYQVDPASFVAQPAGPQLAPHRFPMRATVLGSDNAAYLAQGLGVTQWTGDIATPVGLDLDDGVPADYRGGIVALANGGIPLFALIDATRAEVDPGLYDIYGTGPDAAGVLGETLGLSWLASREPTGWHVRAVADGVGRGATPLFVDESQSAYRVWFGWDSKVYSIDLEQGLLNPLDDPTTEYEPAGSLSYSIADFSFKEAPKLALLAEIRVKMAGSGQIVYPWVQYDEGGAWHPLLNDYGVFGIETNGRHEFLLAANPAQPDPAKRDAPPVGRLNDAMQLRIDLARGPIAQATPVVVFAALHAIKTIRPLVGWQVTLDVGRTYNNVTPFRQRVLLQRLLLANQQGLLHFAYLPDPDGAAGAPEIASVKIIRFSGFERDGLPKDYQGRISLMVSQVITSTGQV